jgi:hypothetical protein
MIEQDRTVVIAAAASRQMQRAELKFRSSKYVPVVICVRA